MPPDPLPCSSDSLAAGEELAGTAVSTRHWLLLETNLPWGRKGLADTTEIPRLARARVEEAVAATGARLQLIRQPDGTDRTGIRVMGVQAAPGARGIRSMQLGNWDAVAQADLIGLIQGTAGEPQSEPVALVCTHGRRDVCCARLGMPVYQAFRALIGAHAWQSSHLGGHRFAPTLVILPQGLQFGRVSADEVAPLWTAAQEGRVHKLDRLRGYTHLPRVAQFAVHGWLGAHPDLPMSAIEVTSLRVTGEGQTRVEGRVDGQQIRMDVHERPMPSVRKKSCADPTLCPWTALRAAAPMKGS